MNKLYETNSYMTSCATIVTNSTVIDGKNYIYLKDSIFFPNEGGQYADTGYIEYNGQDIKLTDGILESSEADAKETIIRYAVEEAIPVNSNVICKLDWNKRFDRMQNHSGEHIISGLIHNIYGYDNVGFHLSDDEPVTLNINKPLSREQIMNIEAKANSVIYANLPITASYPDKTALSAIDYRSKIDILGQVRLITIGDENETIDICACCAPHVAHTGEIGIIKVINSINYKGGTQISILCGRRAIEYINHNLSIISDLGTMFTTHPDNICANVKTLREELNDCKAKISELKEREYIQMINNMSIDDLHIIVTEDELTAGNMKNLFNCLTEKFDGYVGIFVGSDTDGYRYNIGSRNLETVKLAEHMRNALQAKGGGSGCMIQGKVNAKKDDIIHTLTSF